MGGARVPFLPVSEAVQLKVMCVGVIYMLVTSYIACAVAF